MGLGTFGTYEDAESFVKILEAPWSMDLQARTMEIIRRLITRVPEEIPEQVIETIYNRCLHIVKSLSNDVALQLPNNFSYLSLALRFVMCSLGWNNN